MSICIDKHHRSSDISGIFLQSLTEFEFQDQKNNRMINQLIAKILPYFPERIVWIFSSRYISGKQITDALVESRKLNQGGVMVSVDLLGEYVNNLSEADSYKKQYIDLIKRFTD